LTRLIWGQRGERLYEAGVDRGVYYSQIAAGVPWDGLISVTDAPVVSEESSAYFDGQKYRQTKVSDSFACTIEAFTYPDEFFTDAGLLFAGQRPRPFGFSYRTMIGNDKSGLSNYKIHLVYNALAMPSAKNYATQDNTVKSTTFSWDISTTPVNFSGAKPSAHLIVDTSVAYSSNIEDLEAILYGSEGEDPRLPLPQEVFEIFESNSIVRVTDNGDGSFTVEGPDSAVYLTSPTEFEINWPSAVYVDAESYFSSSL
jgi:hypothetical protein